MASRPPVSAETLALYSVLESFLRTQSESDFTEIRHDPNALDFMLGNPQEPPLPGITAAIQRWSAPQHNQWFAYQLSEPEAQEAIARRLGERRGLPFHPEDIVMTVGAFGALATSLLTLAGKGDEVIFNAPPWFFYEAMIVAAGATPVRIPVRSDNFDLDLDAIASALTPRTRAIIVNSPHNPTGKIYPPETLEQLAALLTRASAQQARPIYIISDEAYSQIVFDGREYHSPTRFYPHTLLIYTYGKTLLMPGQRLGYIAFPPTMPERAELREAIMIRQLVGGHTVPNAVMQYAVDDLEDLSIDIAHYQRKRDRMVTALRESGYEVHVPEGTFYLLPKSPWPDDRAFVKLLARSHIYVLPGSVCEIPGYFRISLTANDEMIERALPGFAAAMAHAHQHAPASAPAGDGA